jgi:hypothetical protein
VISNGIIAGEPTEILGLLTASDAPADLAPDPANFGHQIAAGGWMQVELGGSIERNGVENDKPFVPISTNANFILVTGLPQMPITAPFGAGVQHGNYSILDDGNKVITIVPNGGSGDNGLEQARANEIGFKVVHVRPNPNTGVGPSPFTNGPVGSFGTLAVRIYNAAGDLVEQGSGSVRFPSSVGRVVGPTNAGLATGGQGSPATVTAELVESVTFQHVAPHTILTNTVRPAGQPFSAGLPYAPRFLLFEALDGQPDSFIPQKGIANLGYVVKENKPTEAKLVEDSNGNGIPDNNDVVVGKITLNGPSTASSGVSLAGDVLTTSGDGITGPNGSVLNVPIQVGDQAGVYRVMVSLHHGNDAVTTIIVD